MDELISPKIQKSDTGGNSLPEGYEKYLIPPSSTTENKLEIILSSLNSVVGKEIELEKKISSSNEKLEEHNKKLEEYKKDIEKQSNKAIEIIGLFSAILALLIIDVSIIKSATSFLASILLITSLSAVVAIFAILIHILFATEDKQKFGKFIWFPISILIIFIILGVIFQIKNLSWANFSNSISSNAITK